MSSSHASQPLADCSATISTSYDTSQTTVESTSRPKVPAELRLKIWKLIANETRNVDIWVRNITMGTMNPNHVFPTPWMPYALYSSTKVPAVLHVCRESRIEGLKYYTLEFGGKFEFKNTKSNKRFPNMEITLPSQIYINWDVDRICIMRPEDFHTCPDTSNGPDEERILNFVKRCEEMKLKYLAINAIYKRLPSMNPTDSQNGNLINDDGDDNDIGTWPPFSDLIPTGGHLKELFLFSDDRWIGPAERLHAVPGKMLWDDLDEDTSEWERLLGTFNVYCQENELRSTEVDDRGDFIVKALISFELFFCKLSFE